MRFGRSRVQDRARDSDVETVIDDPSAEISATCPKPRPSTSRRISSTRTRSPTPSAATRVTSTRPPRTSRKRMTTAPRDRRAARRDDRRGCTDDRGHTGQTTEIRRLHEVTDDAKRRASRLLATPAARRRLHDAVTEESDALHMLGFVSVRRVRDRVRGHAGRRRQTGRQRGDDRADRGDPRRDRDRSECRSARGGARVPRDPRRRVARARRRSRARGDALPVHHLGEPADHRARDGRDRVGRRPSGRDGRDRHGRRLGARARGDPELARSRERHRRGRESRRKLRRPRPSRSRSRRR